MNKKHNTFLTLTGLEKKQIVLAFRTYLLRNKTTWESIRKQKKIEPSKPKYGLPDKAIKQFMEICKRKGLELTKVEATREAHNLINLYKIL